MRSWIDQITILLEGDVVPFPQTKRPVDPLAKATGSKVYDLAGHLEGQRMLDNVDAFTHAYITAILFTSDQLEEETGEPVTIDRFSVEAIKCIIEDCTSFQQQAGEDDLYEYGQSEAGADFWFTRNGHGVGFWENDHGTPEICAKFNKLAMRFGEVNPVVGDDGFVYIE